ncbi:MAG: 16S rRNA (cytosine(1402)-N(4))-methyltransferase RsmH [bacterium]|nr:16S rRNA (cytosine(1402)-N(4))-methyltransferase RsmH [Candidatus Aquidulcis sp.]
MATGATLHRPVLLAELLAALDVRSDGTYVDANLGGGGHAEAVLEANAPHGRLLGIDADGGAITRSRARLERFGSRLSTFHGNSRDLAQALADANFTNIDGVYFDLGLSSDQLADRARGFGIRAGGELDLRFDTRSGETAATLLEQASIAELEQIFRTYGEEPNAGKIARAIGAAREQAPVATAEELARLIEQVVPQRQGRPPRIHPATRVFQALRIVINDEMTALRIALTVAISALRVGGRIVVLTYHSLEDRIVKQAFAAAARDCICPPQLPVCACNHRAELRLVNKHPITASEQEIADNPRSRSAKLRAAVRLEHAA